MIVPFMRRSELYPDLIPAASRLKMEVADLTRFFSSRSPVLCGLPPEVLSAIARCVDLRRYAAGDPICREGDPAGELWILLEGRVSVNRCGYSGNRLCIEIMLPGDIFGLPALASTRYPSEIRATQASLVAVLAKVSMTALIDRYPILARELLLAMGQRLQFMTSSLLMSRDPLETRAAAALVYLYHKFGPTITLTQTEIGEMVGSAPETAMRLLKDFEARGWIRRGTRAIAITDLPALKALIEQRQAS